MTDPLTLHLLRGAAQAAQKLHKKLRQLANRGDATEADLTDAADACEAVARIQERHGVAPLDIDSRGERRRRRKT